MNQTPPTFTPAPWPPPSQNSGCLAFFLACVGAVALFAVLLYVGVSFGVAAGVSPVVTAGAYVAFRIISGRQRAADAQRLAAAQEAAAIEARKEAARLAAERWERLCVAFGQNDAKRIVGGELWQGASAEMVREMLGEPSAVDEKVLKRATRHTLKYQPEGGNRFGLRVMLENGVVVGWER